MKYIRSSVLLSALLAASAARAASGTWTNFNGGSWTNAANWSSGAIADGAGWQEGAE